MGIFYFLILLFGAVQYYFCRCKRMLLRSIPLCLAIGLFLWIEASHPPGPGCGVATAFEIVLIGSCAVGILLGWIVYGIKAAFKKEG